MDRLPHSLLWPLIMCLFTYKLPAAPVREVITYPSQFPESVGGAQPVALTAELNYDREKSNAPIAVIMHQFSAANGNFDLYRHHAEALCERGFFTIMPAMRGREGSDGARDTGGREIHDILDAVEAAKAQYPELTDGDQVYLTGYSGGGGNVMSALVRFPDYWNAASAFFGISDYGYDTTNGWYFNGAKSSHQAILRADIGDPTPPADPLVTDRYFARASRLASKNNPYAEIHLFVNDTETLVPGLHHQLYRDNAIAAASQEGEFDNITFHLGSLDKYQDFNGDGQNSPDEHQYWKHGTLPTEALAAAEQWFITRMATKSISTPKLNRRDELLVIGYLKTKSFALYLGDGQNAAAELTYTLGDTGCEFSLKILSSARDISTLLKFNATDRADCTVTVSVDGVIVESLPGGDWVSTTALGDGKTLHVEFIPAPK